MRLLVLGAAGFIGRHVLEAARAGVAGADADLDLTAHARSPADAPGWVALDLLTASDAAVHELVAGTRPEVVVNCTGLLSGDPGLLAATNVQLVERLLGVLRAAAPGARFVQVGSAAEYGAAPRGRPI